MWIRSPSRHTDIQLPISHYVLRVVRATTTDWSCLRLGKICYEKKYPRNTFAQQIFPGAISSLIIMLSCKIVRRHNWIRLSNVRNVNCNRRWIQLKTGQTEQESETMTNIGWEANNTSLVVKGFGCGRKKNGKIDQNTLSEISRGVWPCVVQISNCRVPSTLTPRQTDAPHDFSVISRLNS